MSSIKPTGSNDSPMHDTQANESPKAVQKESRGGRIAIAWQRSGLGFRILSTVMLGIPIFIRSLFVSSQPKEATPDPMYNLLLTAGTKESEKPKPVTIQKHDGSFIDVTATLTTRGDNEITQLNIRGGVEKNIALVPSMTYGELIGTLGNESSELAQRVLLTLKLDGVDKAIKEPGKRLFPLNQLAALQVTDYFASHQDEIEAYNKGVFKTFAGKLDQAARLIHSRMMKAAWVNIAKTQTDAQQMIFLNEAPNVVPTTLKHNDNEIMEFTLWYTKNGDGLIEAIHVNGDVIGDIEIDPPVQHLTVGHSHIQAIQVMPRLNP